MFANSGVVTQLYTTRQEHMWTDLATTLHQGHVNIHHLVLPDQHPNGKVDEGQGGNDGLDDTVHQPNQHDDGVIGHLQGAQAVCTAPGARL